MPTSPIPRLAAHGAEMPAIGFGTSMLPDPAAAVAAALAAGYRHLDAARLPARDVRSNCLVALPAQPEPITS